MSEPSASRLRVSAADGRRPQFDGFEEWAEHAGPALLRYAHAITGSSHDAADLSQEALVAVAVRWRRLSERGAPDAYARRVVLNAHTSAWRRFGRREHLTGQTPETAVGSNGSAAGRSGSGGDHAETTGDALLARQLLAELPPRQRAAVVLRFFEDLPYAEIATITGCTESTARSHVRRALQTLNHRLEEDHHDRV